jgi:hypothetical protein
MLTPDLDIGMLAEKVLSPCTVFDGVGYFLGNNDAIQCLMHQPPRNLPWFPAGLFVGQRSQRQYSAGLTMDYGLNAA